MNNCKLEIYENKTWVDYTKYMIASFKFANLLDEALDEGTITLKRVENKPFFSPMTRVRITITNSPLAIYSQDMADKIRLNSDLNFKVSDGIYKSYDGRTSFYYYLNTKKIRIVSVKDFLIASDNGIENSPGSNQFDHEIYLIEQTKYLERFICDSITFTNALGKTFSAVDTKALLKYDILSQGAYTDPIDKEGITESDFFNGSIYINKENNTISLPTLKEVFENEKFIGVKADGYNNPDEQSITLKTINGTIVNISDYSNIKLSSGLYNITYYYHYFSVLVSETRTYTYNFSVYSSSLPLKKWTITDVCNRVFDTVEPLEDNANFKNVKPRFRLQGVKYNEHGEIVKYSDNSFYEPNSQAEKYDKIIAPEFSFTQNTLREVLTEVGGFIHGEPRILRKVETAYDEFWEIGFDEYGSNEMSHISKKQYVSAGFKTNINDYCTSLDSSAQNLVNLLDYAQGVAFEPFYCGETSGKGISIRAENTTMRIAEDDGSFIPTTYKNYMFKGNNQVVITYIPKVGNGFWDITAYIFEKADYDGTLSSFDGAYPYSKAYALYYTQGEKNIYGLFFKPPNLASEALEDYTIVKIIKAVTGNNSLALTLEDLKQVRFSISYLPITNTRVKTAKQNILGGMPSDIVYNQSANLVESKYYGENLKSVVSRLGNVEKTYTYHLAFLSDIPKVGTLFDKDYYISAVSTEVLPQYIRCTIGLSKDFNRLSEYVGISSNKRMWEVSEKMSQERQSIYTEYLVIKRNYDATSDEKNGHLSEDFTTFIFGASRFVLTPINLVEVVTKDKNKNPIATICLPVISVALGNSAIFTFGFQDNFSAGQRVEGDGYTNYVSYADAYGRAYYMDITFLATEPTFLEDDKEVAFNFPLANLDNDNIVKTLKPISITNYRYRKDNREIPQITYELTAITEDESLIIGSALMRILLLVNRNKTGKCIVYGFEERLNKFENEIDISKGEKIGNILQHSNCFKLPKYEGTKTFKSWAIVTPQQEVVERVQDEDGNEFEQVLGRGCELVLGANGEYKSEELIGFEVKGIRDIYEIWLNIIYIIRNSAL